MKRREFVKVVAGTTATSALTSHVNAQLGGPFSLPTAKFSPALQHELPNSAFRVDLPIPAVLLPTAIGTFEDLMNRDSVFGQGDNVSIGECFHGIAREWGETPNHWTDYGCNSALTGEKAWEDKRQHFGEIDHHQDQAGGSAPQKVKNWSGFQIKCYRMSIEEAQKDLNVGAFETRFYSYNGEVPGPSLKLRLGEPCVVRFENQLEAEVSVHLHGGHSPSHSDGFPSFYILQGKARDYFYPNILPMTNRDKDGEHLKGSDGNIFYRPDVGESQSTMWYHDHAMDATAYNVSKGLAGFAPCFGEEELALISSSVLPGYGARSCVDWSNIPYESKPKLVSRDAAGNYTFGVDTTDTELLKELEDPQKPGFYKRELEPYYNPFDVPLVLQDKVIDDNTCQISYDLTDHNGYLGDTFMVNGVPWPKLDVLDCKYRLRILNGSNARVYRLRLMKAEDYERAVKFGVSALPGDTPPGGAATVNAELAGDHAAIYDLHSEPVLRIGKDSWLWSEAVEIRSVVLAMANRADLVLDFEEAMKGLADDQLQEFVLVNTMPQSDGRGPKLKLEDGGDPRVLPLPFATQDNPLVELHRPIGLMKFVVGKKQHGTAQYDKPDQPVTVRHGTPLIKTHRKIVDDEIKAVREFIFERGKGAWMINGRFYDPNIANAAPTLDGAEEWVLRNEGGGWWHPIHIHLESHQLVGYEKDFAADGVIVDADPPPPNVLDPKDILSELNAVERIGLHDTQVLGPNTVVRIRMRHRTWGGPFVFHCHNLEHEDMRMMYNFELVPGESHDPDIAPAARTHGNDVTFKGTRHKYEKYVGEPPWHHLAVPRTSIGTAGEYQIPPRDGEQ